MGRGTAWVFSGAFLILLSLCGGLMAGRLAAEVAAKAASEKRPPDQVAVPVSTLGCFGLVLNVAFYAGLVCISVGVTLTVVDGDRPVRETIHYNPSKPSGPAAGGDERPPSAGDPPWPDAMFADALRQRAALFDEALRRQADRDRGAEPPPPAPGT